MPRKSESQGKCSSTPDFSSIHIYILSSWLVKTQSGMSWMSRWVWVVAIIIVRNASAQKSRLTTSFSWQESDWALHMVSYTNPQTIPHPPQWAAKPTRLQDPQPHSNPPVLLLAIQVAHHSTSRQRTRLHAAFQGLNQPPWMPSMLPTYAQVTCLTDSSLRDLRNIAGNTGFAT